MADNISVLNQSVTEGKNQLLQDFAKVKYKIYPKIVDYHNAMSQILDNYTFEKSETINKKGQTFHFFHLTTKCSNRFKHVDNVFNYPKWNFDKIGRDMMFCNTLLSYIIFVEMKLIQEKIQDMIEYKMYPIRWTHVNKGTKHVFLNIPKGEFQYFIHKSQEFTKFSYEWFSKVLREPVVVYCLGFKRFQISKDGKYLKEQKNELLISKHKKADTKLAHSYIVLRAIKDILTMFEEKPQDATFYDTLIMDLVNEPFWYYRSGPETSSISWSHT